MVSIENIEKKLSHEHDQHLESLVQSWEINSRIQTAEESLSTFSKLYQKSLSSIVELTHRLIEVEMNFQQVNIQGVQSSKLPSNTSQSRDQQITIFKEIFHQCISHLDSHLHYLYSHICQSYTLISSLVTYKEIKSNSSIFSTKFSHILQDSIDNLMQQLYLCHDSLSSSITNLQFYNSNLINKHDGSFSSHFIDQILSILSHLKSSLHNNHSFSSLKISSPELWTLFTCFFDSVVNIYKWLVQYPLYDNINLESLDLEQKYLHITKLYTHLTRQSNPVILSFLHELLILSRQIQQNMQQHYSDLDLHPSLPNSKSDFANNYFSNQSHYDIQNQLWIEEKQKYLHLSHQLSSLFERFQKLETERNSYINQLNHLNQRLLDSQSELKLFKSTIKKTTAENIELKKQLYNQQSFKKCQTENNNQKQQNQIHILSKQNQDHRQLWEYSKQECSSYQKKYQNLLLDYQVIQKNLKNLRNTISNKDQLISNYRQRLEKYDDKKSDIYSQYLTNIQQQKQQIQKIQKDHQLLLQSYKQTQSHLSNFQKAFLFIVKFFFQEISDLSSKLSTYISSSPSLSSSEMMIISNLIPELSSQDINTILSPSTTTDNNLQNIEKKLYDHSLSTQQLSELIISLFHRSLDLYQRYIISNN